MPARRTSKTSSQTLRTQVERLPGTRRTELPRAVEPALADLRKFPPLSDDWLHEIKSDGYRLVARLDRGNVQLRTRQGNNWTVRFPEIAAAVARLPANEVLLDGEVAALSSTGVTSFPGLQQALSKKRTSALVYHVFDLLHLDGWDLRSVELESRKALLRELLADNADPRIQYVDHVVGNGEEFLNRCRELGLEGIVSKRRQSVYRSGRSDNWLKTKCVRLQPFVVGGYTSLKGKAEMRSLVLGQYDDSGRLIYVGRVGTGFSERTLVETERKLQSMTMPTCPFDRVPPREPNRVMHWVRPELVAGVRFTDWSADGVLRHPSFVGFVEDTLR